MKKLKVMALLVILLSTFLYSNTSYAERLFIDVDEKHPHYAEVKYLYDLGLVDSSLSAFYGIDGDAMRKDVIVMLGKALGLDGTKRKTSFKDVPKNHYASGYIQSAVDAGIVGGYPDGTFRSNDKLNRGHLSVFIERAYRQSLPNGGQIEFKDIRQTHTAYESVKKIAAANITAGYPDGTFKPEVTLSRKHLTTIMYRTMQFLGKEAPEVANKVYSRDDLQSYLNGKYQVLQTKLINVNFSIKISENDIESTHYDYLVELGFDSAGFEQTMNAHLRSMRNAGTAEQDVALARKQLNDFLEKMAMDIIQKTPQKKILAQTYDSGYLYPNLKLGRNYRTDYSWTNYEPIQMKHQWPGNQPADYGQVMSILSDPSDPKVIQYSKEEKDRWYYISEYSSLKYGDFKITNFDWRVYLNGSYNDPKYHY